MKLELTSEDVHELLVILNLALYDVESTMRQGHEVEEMVALRDHQATLRKWIHRLSTLDDDTP